jgi:hypothetical protein
MNIGEAMTGRERFCNAAGRAMANSLTEVIGKPIIDPKKYDRAETR